MLLHRTTGVPLAETARALWGDADADTARREVRRYLARLGKDLAGVEVSLDTASGTLRMTLPAGSVVDEVQFRADADVARADFAAGRRHAASVAALRGLARWRDDVPYPEVQDTAAGRNAGDELGRLRAEIEDLTIGLALIDGPTPRRLVTTLEDRVTRLPRRELAWRQLMAALVASGRSAEAVRAFGRCRAALGATAPSDATRAVENAVLDHGPIAPALLLPVARATTVASDPHRRVGSASARETSSPLVLALRRAWADPARALVAVVTPDHLPGLPAALGDAVPGERTRIVALDGAGGAPGALEEALEAVSSAEAGAEARLARLALARLNPAGGVARRDAIRAVVRAMLAAAPTRPLVVVVSDAHRADPGIRILVDELAAGPGPVLLVVAAPESDWLPGLGPLLRRPGAVISRSAHE